MEEKYISIELGHQMEKSPNASKHFFKKRNMELDAALLRVVKAMKEKNNCQLEIIAFVQQKTHMMLHNRLEKKK
jgi:hypothetical protein